MKATEVPVITFLTSANVQFIIPVYQRNYDWALDESSQLLNDIISAGMGNRSTHFIGSIVYIQEGVYNTGEVRELVIIDGQQRLTTITILYVALYRFAKDKGMVQESDRLYNMFLVNQYVREESSKLKLKQTDTNSQAFLAILHGNEKGFPKYSNVIENYNFFSGQITENNFDTIQNGLKRLIFVEISLERDKDDPQRIFESLNSTGLDLSQSDLIRNYILMDLQPKEQQKVFNGIWAPIEENARDLDLQKPMVSAFIRDYLTFINKKIPNKSKVYLEFKKNYPDKKEEGYMNDLESIKALSFHYKMFLNPRIVEDHEIRKELSYIKKLEINVAYPFLLQVFEDWDNGTIEKGTLLRILKLIQNYVWRRFMTSLPTNALNSIFMALYAEIDPETYYDSLAMALIIKKGTSRFPNDEEVTTALKERDMYNINAKNRAYLFEMLENHNNREYVDTSYDGITVEHIFPQNPSPIWEEQLSEDDYFLFKEKYINTISNLTLSGNNGALGNKSFLEKKTMNRENGEQGYIHSRLWLNDFLKKIPQWNNETYTTRLKFITDRFFDIWPYPNVQIPIQDDTVEQNIFDAESPRGKKLEYFIFNDTKIEESVISNMTQFVLRELYSMNAELFLNNDKIKISRDREVFRNAQEIANGYFIEYNMDSESKFNLIKRMLTLYDLEESLIIKYDLEAALLGNRFKIRKEYWTQLLPLIKGTNVFANVSPSKSSWVNAGAGKTGVNYVMVVTGSYCHLELALITAVKETNKKYFRKLLANRTEIEKAFGSGIIWQELPDKKMSRIKIELENFNIFDREDWTKGNNFFVETLPKFVHALQEEISKL